MKIVLIYEVSDFESWTSIILPFEYESKEKAKDDLLEIWRNWQKGDLRNADIIFAGHQIHLYHLTTIRTVGDENTMEYDKPTILTLDEWWEMYKGDN